MRAQERPLEAAAVYREDLRPGRHPKNIWALRGLQSCLQRLPPPLASAPGRSAAAEEPQAGEEMRRVRAELEEAQAAADVAVHASCGAPSLSVRGNFDWELFPTYAARVRSMGMRKNRRG